MSLPDRILYRPTPKRIRALVARANVDISAADRDEMAIPSYLHDNSLIRWLMWRRYEVIAELANFSGSQHALEFGCGLGLFLPTLAGHCREVSAVELFPAYAQELCRQMNLKVGFLDAITQLPEQSLDLIVAADVLEHVEPLEDFLRQFHARLKPGGRLVVSGPTENLAYKLGRVLAGFAGKGGYHHTNILRINAALQNTGFDLVENRRLPFSCLPALFKVSSFARH